MKNIFIMLTICCACIPKEYEDPYIRIQPQIEYCNDMCSKFKQLNCKGYFEDIEIDCSSDNAYKDMEQCKNNKVIKLSCEEFCKYEMKNSVQLNPKCLSDNLLNCDEIEIICK